MYLKALFLSDITTEMAFILLRMLGQEYNPKITKSSRGHIMAALQGLVGWCGEMHCTKFFL